MEIIILLIRRTSSNAEISEWSDLGAVKNTPMSSIRSWCHAVKPIINVPFRHSFYLFTFMFIGWSAYFCSPHMWCFLVFLLSLLFILICFDAVNRHSLSVSNKIIDACSTSVDINQERRKKEEKNNKYKDDVMRTVLLNWLNLNVISFVYFVCTSSFLSHSRTLHIGIWHEKLAHIVRETMSNGGRLPAR